MNKNIPITADNALYPHLKPAELSPGQYMQEWRHKRPDVREDEAGMNTRAASTKKTKLSEPQVRYIRVNYKEIGKAKLAEMFSISSAFTYKVATNRAMTEVPDEGEVFEPGK